MPQADGIQLAWIYWLSGCLAAAIWIYNSKRRSQALPPGPTGWPIAGSVWSLPNKREWLVYEQWAQKYDSDVISYTAWGQIFIVLNSQKAASDLLERKSANYVDRPPMPMLNGLCGWHWDLAFMRHGDDWKRARRLFAQHFRPAVSAKFRAEETRCARELVRDVLRDEAALFSYTRLAFGKLILSVTYGIDVSSPGHQYIAEAQKALTAIAAAGNFGSYVVDHIPLLRHIPAWLPGAGFQRKARAWKEGATMIGYGPLEDVRKAMSEGTARPSVARALLEEYGENMMPEQERAIVSATGTAYEAASESTMSALLSIILAMLLCPDVQRKAHAELDRVVGRDRFPEFSDQAAMPYLTAICKESLRWNPSVPLSVMNRVTQDDTYKGYHIPAGATVITNAWAILHDPETYPSPHAFMPERFLTPAGELDPAAPEPEAAFGFGRRACAGAAMAQDTLWIYVASVLWAFEVERAVDAQGRPVDVTGAFTSGAVCYPEKFPCRMKVRGEGVRGVIAAETVPQ